MNIQEAEVVEVKKAELAELWGVVCSAAMTLAATDIMYPTDKAGTKLLNLHHAWNAMSDNEKAMRSI